MTDYSDAEVGAIESTFPGCKVYLCDFHREQAWERWVKDRKHGLSPVDGEVLLELLRKCATASPAVGVPAVDQDYQQAVDNLSTDQQSLDSFFGSTQSGGSLDEQDDTVHNDIQTLSEIPQTKVCQACLNLTMFMHMLSPSHAFLSGNNVSYTFSTDLHCITQTGGCTC